MISTADCASKTKEAGFDANCDPKTKLAERDDAYGAVIVCLPNRYRVIICKHGIQWILQRRDAHWPHRGFWRGKSYHRNRDSLIRVCVGLQLDADPIAMARLHALPRRINKPD